MRSHLDDGAHGHDEQVQAAGCPGKACALSDERSVVDWHDVTMTAQGRRHIGLQAGLVVAGRTSRV